MLQYQIPKKFGNSCHILLPKEYLGKKIKFLVETKTFQDIKSELIELLNPYLEEIQGIYLYGSYARNEQSHDSDIDILVVTNNKLKIKAEVNNYSIISITQDELEKTLERNPILILPIIQESKAILNATLIEQYKKYKLTKQNTQKFREESKKTLEIVKDGLNQDFEIGSLVYSLILRIRGLLIISLSKKEKQYSKSELFKYLKNKGLTQEKIEEFYSIHSKEKKGMKVRESKLTKQAIEQLIKIEEGLLKELQR